MLLSESSLEDLKDIFRAELDEHLTDAEAYRKGRILLNLYKAVYGEAQEQFIDVNT
jgi:hypothetical protein